MNETPNRRLTEEGVREDLQRQPHLFLKLAENALTVAESLRDNYFSNTASFVTALRRAVNAAASGKRDDSILEICAIGDTEWADVQGEVVTFIDGGVGAVQISSQVPILLRVGSYCVRTGERRLSEREQFGYYPVIRLSWAIWREEAKSGKISWILCVSRPSCWAVSPHWSVTPT